MSVSTRRARILAAVGLTALLAPFGLAVTPAFALTGGDEVGIYANPGETVTVDFTSRDGQHTWVVPQGVTEVTIDVAAGSGSREGGGGVGGHATVVAPVEPGESLSIVVGGAGSADGLSSGGGASAVARSDEFIVIAGGGGGAASCYPTVECGTGGAGGLSATSGGTAGLSASWEDERYRSLLLLADGRGATASGPGDASQRETMFYALNYVVYQRSAVGDPVATPSGGAQVVDGVITLSPVATSSSVSAGEGGRGYFTGGTGSSASIYDLNPPYLTYDLGAGGGGGSGYVADDASLMELRDNVGDGFASISYVVPEPEVVDAPELGLTLDVTSVPAGGSFTLGGAGFDPERAYPVILNSDPVLLGTVTTDAEGAFRAALLIPATVPPGDHLITVGDASIPITVTAAAAVAEGDALAFADAPELAATGPDPLAASILGALTVALLASGAAAIRASRQPSPARQAATRAR